MKTTPLCPSKRFAVVLRVIVPSQSHFVLLTIVSAVILLSAGCAKAVKLQARYDDEAINTFPKSQPLPTPPQDVFSWGQIDVVTRVISSGGSNQVRVVPSQKYLNTGKYRAFVLNAFSEALTTSSKPGVRGGVTVNMQGSGRMVIAIRAAQGTGLQGDPLGGYLFINVGIPSIGFMTTQNLKVMQANPSILNSTMLSPYTSGQAVELRWSIDQNSRTMSLGATPSGGSTKTESVQFSQVAADGSQNTPLQKIWIAIDMFEVPNGTQVLFDNFFVEEY